MKDNRFLIALVKLFPGGSGVRHLLNGNLATLVVTVALAGSATTLWPS